MTNRSVARCSSFDRPFTPRDLDRAVARLRAASPLPAWCVEPTAFAAIGRCLARTAPSPGGGDPALQADALLLLFAVEALVFDPELALDEVALRADQIADCAAGLERPEVAFDPVARFARDIGAQIARGEGGGPWARAWAPQLRRACAALVQARAAGATRATSDAPATFAEELGVAMMTSSARTRMGREAAAEAA